jgi:hypothetical protein
MALAKKRKVTLLVAKLDRLSRSVAFIATLMESPGFDLAIADKAGRTSSSAIAADLNARGIAAPNSSRWFSMQVIRARRRFGLRPPDRPSTGGFFFRA